MQNSLKSYLSEEGKKQLELFQHGVATKAYLFLGAHAACINGADGYLFCCWAPYAVGASVVGDFNEWDPKANPMEYDLTSGVFYIFIAGILPGQYYKYVLFSKDGILHYKADPYGYYAQKRPETASITANLDGYRWKDAAWEHKKRKSVPYHRPLSIYEVHLGSWRRHADGSFYSYRELAEELTEYVLEMGYTHIEVLPVMEHPYDGSWGYQVTGFYAATSRFGTPQDFMYFVDVCHQKNIGVIMDWVPAHFPRDAHGLRRFDGSALYEYEDPRIGEHKAWGTLVFDYTKPGVLSFLISNAYFWMEQYHIDGLRVDAVSSMLYRDYDRPDGQWIPNRYGTRENLEAIAFLQQLNTAIFADFPNALMIAEESTAWAKVTKPVDAGGLGFNFKWNMGFMNDMLRYLSMDSFFRKFHHNILTFLMVYAFSENYILPLSHDECVHGKSSLLGKMYGAYEEKFAQLKAFYGYMAAHPGKKLLFMGGEFAQFDEWNHEKQLDWMLLEYDSHRNMQSFVKNLNHLYLKQKCLWQNEADWNGFAWVNEHDQERSVISFRRIGKAKGDCLLVITNFTPVKYENYRMGVPSRGKYEEIMNSDDIAFGGASVCKTYTSARASCDGFPYSVCLDLPPYTTLYLKRRRETRPKKADDILSEASE